METFNQVVAGNGHIVVMGLGYVGLPLAVALAEKVSVIGYDASQAKVDLLQSGIDPTEEVGNERLRQSKVRFTIDPADIALGDFIIVAVPTPINPDHTPDLEFVRKASETIGKYLKDGAIVVYESTVYPGVTEELCVPEIEKASGKVCGKDFFIGYSPERINPGDKVHRLENICKIVSGMNRDVCDELAKMYGLAVEHIHKANSIKVAEAAKLLENTQRDINIALMNEAAMIFNAMGVSTAEVVEAMNTKWNALGFRPGLVGGHCIGVDPYYLIYKANLNCTGSQLVTTARQINDHMSRFIVDVILNKMIVEKHSMKNDKIYFFGVTFKENCPDLRNSRAMDIIHLLQSYGLDITIIDPYADRGVLQDEYGLTTMPYEAVQDIHDADALIFAVEHDAFKAYGTKTLQAFTSESYPQNKSVVIDIKNMYDKDAVEAAGLAYWGL